MSYEPFDARGESDVSDGVCGKMMGGVINNGGAMMESHEVLGNVGGGLVEQRARRLEMRGEKLNLMCVGEGGLGKKGLHS